MKEFNVVNYPGQFMFMFQQAWIFFKVISCAQLEKLILKGRKNQYHLKNPSYFELPTLKDIFQPIPFKMKKTLLLVFITTALLQTSIADTPDSAYIFSYATTKNNAHNGLHFAWSIDKKAWHAIGPEHSFVKSDFGAWGSEKKMFDPFLFLDNSGKWHCIWSLNKDVGQFAHAASDNLTLWWRQSYPETGREGNFLMPEISYDKASMAYIITWLSKMGDETHILKVTTQDFKHYTPAVNASKEERLGARKEIMLLNEPRTGTIHYVSWAQIQGLINETKLSKYDQQLESEKTIDDPIRFKTLKPIDASITLEPSNSKPISNMLTGIFFEDINYAADGGLYAELIQNRDFEYNSNERNEWDHFTAWGLQGKNGQYSIDTASPIHPNNKHYVTLNIEEIGTALINEGFDGIEIHGGEKYNFSAFVRKPEGTTGKLLIRLVDKQGNIVAETLTNKFSNNWTRIKATLSAKNTAGNCHIQIMPQVKGQVAMDMVSLFPQHTFKGHENGLRADLAETIADIRPRFIRFPGGCVAHGNGLGNIYRWKNTIGPLESRKPQRNLWGYHQSAGLGYFEYFQFCEDIGAEPLPVIAAGVPCQNSSIGGHGQQGGLPMCDMDEYVQDILDLIEWANGDKNTKWGKKRAEAGHPDPFNLKYVGIGNEDLITDIFEERFTMIYKAIGEKYPEITVIGTVGPFYKGTDYEEGWRLATRLNVPVVDEHYYQSPGWFIYNQDFYDKYDRSKPKVYLGEYASHLPGRPNNIETALSEALYMTGLERNGDVVVMSSYAPLLAKEGHTQWNPDLIYFNNKEVKPTVGYYVQKLYGQNSGDEYISSKVSFANMDDKVTKRIAVSAVRDKHTQDIIIKLVNLLPVEINSELNTAGLPFSGQDAEVTVLKGRPDDKNAKPETGTIKVSGKFNYQMPPYSFSVVRIHTN